MKVITIAREFGAGGHTVGRKVAERLGVEFYDRDIIMEAARESGLDLSQIEKEEEVMTRTDSILRAITPASYDAKDAVYEYERHAIIELAKKGPCVILGRCASAIMDEAGIDSMNVFLYADEEARMKRVGEMKGLTDPDAILRVMRKIDNGRSAYYSTYTNRKWRDMHEYTLALDTGALGRDACVDIICKAAE